MKSEQSVRIERIGAPVRTVYRAIRVDGDRVAGGKKLCFEGRNGMAKILVLYYSSWGHMEQMAKSAAEGAREAGATVTIKRVKELVPGGGRQGGVLQARPGGADRRPAGAREL